MSHLNVSSPCFGSLTSGSTSLSGATGAGFCFFFKKASFRLAFLLSVDGLGFFLILPGVSEARPLSLASREKEKEEPTLTFEGEVEDQALASQRLAEVQTLG